MKQNHRTLSIVLTLILLLSAIPVARAEQIVGPQSIAIVSADLTRSGYDLHKYGRVSLGKSETVYYVVVLQQKAIWPWAEYTDYEYYSGFSNSGSAVYGALTSPPAGYWYRVVVHASSASFPSLQAVSGEVFY